MIDTHAHLDFDSFDEDREVVIKRTFDGGVESIINIGSEMEGSRKSLKIARTYDRKYGRMYASVGLHPHVFNEEGEITDEQKSELEKLAKDERVVAIGEIGLDYFSHTGEKISKKQKEDQKQGFIEQVKIAQKLDLPIIIHARGSQETPTDAYEDLYKIILNTKYNILNTKLVFHCYAGDTEFTRKLLENENILFSFTGNVTYKVRKDLKGTKNDIREVVKMIPLEKIMIETDSPFLSPEPHRGKRNEPANVQFVAQKIAELKNENLEKIKKITTQTAKEFFGLDF